MKVEQHAWGRGWEFSAWRHRAQQGIERKGVSVYELWWSRTQSTPARGLHFLCVSPWWIHCTQGRYGRGSCIGVSTRRVAVVCKKDSRSPIIGNVKTNVYHFILLGTYCFDIKILKLADRSERLTYECYQITSQRLQLILNTLLIILKYESGIMMTNIVLLIGTINLSFLMQFSTHCSYMYHSAHL